MSEDNVFAGRTGLVTGGGNGIGKAITAALLERGSNVVVLEISPENAEAAAAELPGGERLTFVQGSVSVRVDVEEG
ncbi:SDR family NAD(P)-dependent oxidoreductase [Pseudonocardia dioxanivorans]|jgi:3-oxoacyl-[acyl-carrier protein] reductase|uniref:SDR family NAD(P)-dependent oxidoreductase n=1 Tax=Pseudonocardia dioxanivorans TaxID=240495 RepID=UPI0018F89A30|nr:SDR family NAD(P)-dependent oxidoreductase [Pseudonocardia dioxanivorans]